MKLAVTGGTGFVGGHLLDLAIARGHTLRALTRRPQPARDGIVWIEGALDRPESLAWLCEGTDAVIHIAGVINGDREAFHSGNVNGTENMVAAAEPAGVKRFVHVSSLAAREPQLSVYGWSKCQSEAPVRGFLGNWTIIRPPAIYGPGDREILGIFRAARFGVLPLPPAGHLSLLHVDDLCRLLLDCIYAPESHGKSYEPDDGVPGGWEYRAFARAIGEAIGRRVLPLPLPKALLGVGAGIDRLLRGQKAQLTPDRVAYFCHPDWTAHAERQPPASLWQAQIDSRTGLTQTAAWYRAQGWLGR
ncbi:uncharacterized protein YbjT (DUF2867 family) [Sphingomonas vulcanisoli]|uniref:Uncharacterized protein YbjT (DUF2867 family) n=1 Tax=Sphingomonas vulcanisoli TaxID=1658060 RepID=A0ABX0TVP0_9SPHN|nr:NAD-dependent epimerase/dehydratase family protein [Sphingomonas vulcanisoli]NIJ09501.1 uncharacterized protein YbjT (DUF2867 family) [Sphingomonas vulcanisoli]